VGHMHSRRHSPRRHGATRRVLASLVATAATVALAACAPTRFETQTDMPQPLIEKIPIVVGVHMPREFSEKVYEEKRENGGGEYSIGLGKAQAAGFMRILNAMFNRVVPVAAPAAGAATDPEIRGVLEPVLVDFSFVTPIDSGSPMYAASLRYTIKLYSPTGELAESWTFTGYGSQPASQFPGKGDEALALATRLAMRDAGAKLAAEFREQAIARGLLPSARPAVPAEVEAPPPSRR
jgi:hypothetical protein